MKRFFWKIWNKQRNWPESKELTDLIYKCIWLINNCPSVSVTVDKYSITIRTSSSEVELWNENKFYGWLHRGKVNGRKFQNISASLDAMYDFKCLLKEKGYDIYIKEENPYSEVLIHDVKC